MEIEDTALFEEIKTVIDEGPKPINYYYTCKFLIDEVTYDPLKVLSITNQRDYVNSFGDQTIISVAIPNGLWTKVIYPNLHITDIILLKTPIYEVSEEVDEEQETIEKRFTAVLINDKNPDAVVAANSNRLSMAAMDTAGFSVIEFQLIEKSIEALSMVTVGGIWRRETGKNVIEAILSKESEKIKTINGKAVEFVDVTDAQNENKREHVIIPQGVKLIDVPHYIQQNCGGVYTSGINSYFQNKGWFVFPLYDITKYPKAKYKTTILKVPKQRFTGIERTYRVDGDVLYILGTNDSSFKDSSFTNNRNLGDGLRFSDSRQFLRDIVKKESNKAIITRDEVNHEFVFKDKDDLPDYRKQLNVHLSVDSINSNVYVEKTKLTSTNGALYEIDWENSDPDLLIPGMLMRIIYLEKNEFKEIYGVLSYVMSYVQLRGQNLTAKRHITTTKLIIFCSSITTQEIEYDENDEQTKNAWQNYEMG